MIPNNLSATLASRKKYIDEASEVISTIGIGNGLGTSPAFLSSPILRDSYFNSKSETGYAGLVNQEFRINLLSWKYNPSEHGEEAYCLTRQLQILFSRLLLSHHAAMSTIQLTKSFGWTSNDSFLQQDIQECMTVIFDFISTQCEGSSFNTFIFHTFYGELNNMLKCTNCHIPRIQLEKFKEIQLQVRGFESIEQSLSSYLQEEILEGVNCDECSAKHNHLKIIKFSKLPPILTIQLKRFDLDYNTFQRIKLNDHIRVPLTLDLQHVVAESTSISELYSKKYELVSVLVHVGSAFSGHYFCYIKDLSSGKWLLFNDSNVTELSPEQISIVFGVSQPSMAAAEPCTNSTSTTSNDFIMQTKTNSIPQRTTTVVPVATSAYMLLYRLESFGQCTATTSAHDIEINSTCAACIPDDLCAMVLEENAKYLIEKAEWELKKLQLTISVSFSGKSQSITVLKTDDVGTLVDRAFTAFVEHPEISSTDRNRVCLRVFDPLRGVREGILGDETKLLSEIPVDLSRRSFMIEIISDSSSIELEKEDFIQLQVSLYAPEILDGPPFTTPVLVNVPFKLQTTVMIEYILKHLNLAFPGCNSPDVMLIDKKSGRAIKLSSSSASSDSAMWGAVKDGDCLYIDAVSNNDNKDECARQPLRKSLVEYFDELTHMINLTYNAPVIGGEINQEHVYGSSESITDSRVTSVIASSRGRDGEVSIDSRKTMKDLKGNISNELSIPISAFRLHEDRSGSEWKDLSLTIADAGLIDGHRLRIVLGTPLTPNQFRIQVRLVSDATKSEEDNELVVTKPNGTDNGTDTAAVEIRVSSYPARPGGCEVIVNERDTISDVKILLLQQQYSSFLGLMNASEEGLSMEHGVHLRLRKCEVSSLGGYRVGTVLKDSDTLRKALGRLSDNMMLAVQTNVTEPSFTENDLLVEYRLWRPSVEGSLERLSSGTEVIIPKSITFGEFKVLISQTIARSTNNSLPNRLFCSSESLLVVKALPWQLKDLSNVNSMKWTTQPSESSTLTGPPWRLQDGSILLIRDIREGGLPHEEAQCDANPTPASRDGEETGFRLFSAQEQASRSIALEKEEEEKKALINERMKQILDARRYGNGNGNGVDGRDHAVPL